MDLCHRKNSELEPKFLKCKGRVVFRGDIVKDDLGSYAVFTEQGTSVSQMTAVKVMDIISTKGQNHGPVWKTQLFLLNEICTVILWQDCCGNGNLIKFYWNTVGKKFQTVNVHFSTEKNYFCLYTWTI